MRFEACIHMHIQKLAHTYENYMHETPRVAPSQPGWETWGPHVSQRTSCAHRQSAPVPTLALLFLLALFPTVAKSQVALRVREGRSGFQALDRPPRTRHSQLTRSGLQAAQQVAPYAQLRSCGAGAAATRTG